MELIKRTTLHNQEGSSDKIYEVDLCEVAANQYAVSFRYGRRGSNLKEGTKTDNPVDLKAAQQIFDKLVASKVKGGYQEIALPEKFIKSSDPIARQDAILKCIAAGGSPNWSLERAIWRAGELKLAEATPLLIPLLGSGNALRDYCIAAALGNCGDATAISTLTDLHLNSTTPEFVSRIAFEALLKLWDAPTRNRWQSQKIRFLPSADLKNTAQNGSSDVFSDLLSKWLSKDDYQRFAILDTLYQIDNQYVRPALLNILKTAPLKPNYWQRMRHIFKMAEYRQDAEVVGILAYRFAKESAMFDSDSYYLRLPDGTWINRYTWEQDPQTRRYTRFDNPEYTKAIHAPDAKVSYSQQTRNYLIRRIWRTLRKLGEAENLSYTNLATEILLQYSDRDGGSARQSTFYRWAQVAGKWQSVAYHNHWDTFASYHLLYHILYENSDRYQLKHGAKAWSCIPPYKPGDAEPEKREEAFPALWLQNPSALLKLLLESNCHPVHKFAIKAMGECQDFVNQIPLSDLVKLLQKPYEVTAKLAFELVETKYDAQNFNVDLILAALNAKYQPARARSHEWILAQPSYFLQDSNFIATLITNEYLDNRLFARELLANNQLDENTAKVFIGRLIAILIGLEGDENHLATEIGETLLASFPTQLSNLGLGVIVDLLKHPLPEVQQLGAQILLNHQIQAVDLPSELIQSLLDSPSEPIRLIGIRILGKLPASVLASRYDLLQSMVTHKLLSIRTEVRPIIGRLSQESAEFSQRLTNDLLKVLQRREKVAGIHEDLVSILQNEVTSWMALVTKQQVMKLLESPSNLAQELGAKLLADNAESWLAKSEILDLVKLASHELVRVREIAISIFRQRLSSIKTDADQMKVAVKLLESKWEDTQNSVRSLFAQNISLSEWTPEVLISICDSVKPEVREFGKNLVVQTFQSSNGEEYLLKLSEHPSADIQLFVTDYLTDYASGKLDKLQELKSYFIRVLSLVNRGGVAKKRVLNFLEKQAKQGESIASLIAEIMNRQSLSICMSDRDRAIQILHRIKQNYPQISSSISVKPVTLIRP